MHCHLDSTASTVHGTEVRSEARQSTHTYTRTHTHTHTINTWTNTQRQPPANITGMQTHKYTNATRRHAVMLRNNSDPCNII